jgi:uncharacterized protein (DUF2236 family)
MLIERVRDRVTDAASRPFRHAPYPLAGTLEHRGDPGLLGPDSVSWAVMGDVATFVGGVRALLIQAAHPEVVAGVGDHSRYRDDPLGRLSRTSAYVTATTYGARPEVERAVATVRRIHNSVSGVSSRGLPYDAEDPMLSAWVHNALTDSFLAANQVYGGHRLSSRDADRFVAEQTRIGELLDASPLPNTAAGLARWMAEHPDVAPSPEMRDAVDFLTDPPLDAPLKLGYTVLLQAAVATIPPPLRAILGLRRKRGSTAAGRSAISALRWAMGYSPSWQLALIRVGAPEPAGCFRQDPLAAGRRSPGRAAGRATELE